MPTAEQLCDEVVRQCSHELEQSLGKIERALERLPAEHLWNRAHENENAIGNLLLHLAGNLRQWIICGVGGQPDTRDRASEFAQREALPLDGLLAKLRATVEEAEATLDAVTPDVLLEKRRIQVYEVTGTQALLHVITHFSEHTGQILWAVKRMTGEDLAFYAHLSPKPAETA
ncbi:MAG: DUF1572 family protein [Bryobacterales bacterium]|nr:DUF1572 family protein [Bryobacterales bacterium]